MVNHLIVASKKCSLSHCETQYYKKFIDHRLCVIETEKYFTAKDLAVEYAMCDVL